MKHIINKLLLINDMALIEDVISIIKVTYIICSSITILPPTIEEWNKNKIIHNSLYHVTYSYTNTYGIKFISIIGSVNNWTWSMCIDPIISPISDFYDIIYIINNIAINVDFEKLNINCKHVWYNKKCFYDDYHSNNIVPVYYFPLN